MMAGLIFTSCTEEPSKEIGVMEFPEGEIQLVVRGKEIDWKPTPPGLPPNAQIAILEGSPKKADMFTVRFRMTGEFFMPAHTHPKDERVTIIEGNAYVAFGKDVSKKEATKFGPGDYYINKREEIHTVWADSGCVLQITGIGPWEAHFVE